MSPRLRSTLAVLCGLLPLLAVPAHAVPEAPAAVARLPAVEIAIAPFLPVQQLVERYEPMRLWLQRRLKTPVVFVTAPSYRSFHQHTLAQRYDYVITVANAAHLAQTEAGYLPLLRPAIPSRPTLVVRADSRLSRLSELRGQTLALPDALSLIAMQALDWLRETGMDPARDLTVLHLPNHGAAINYVISGEAAAAIISDRAPQQIAPAARQALRVVQAWDQGAAPGVVYLARPGLPPAEVQRFTSAVLEYVASSEGRALMAQLGYGTLVPMKRDESRPLATYAAALKALLQKSER